VHVALAYPDVYDIGQSNLGLGILYDILNGERMCSASASMLPGRRHGAGDAGERHAALEPGDASSHPRLRSGGLLAQLRVDLSNVLNMLDLAGIPLLAVERTAAVPIVIGGGSGALNPEPMPTSLTRSSSVRARK
jgi:hypothetical protein